MSDIHPQKTPSLIGVSAAVKRLAKVITDSVDRPIDQTRENLRMTASALNNIASFVQIQPTANNTV